MIARCSRCGGPRGFNVTCWECNAKRRLEVAKLRFWFHLERFSALLRGMFGG